jgi:hypothetical protein
LDDTTQNFFGVARDLKNGVPLCGTRQNTGVALDLSARQALIALAVHQDGERFGLARNAARQYRDRAGKDREGLS